MRRVAIVVALLAVGCGGSSSSGDGGGGSQPVSHSLAVGEAEDVPANEELDFGPFTVPQNAVVDYSIVDTPTGIGNDTMNVGVLTQASVGTASAVAYGVQHNVSSASGQTQPLPAGTYDFVAQCLNIVDDCIFDLTLTAVY